MSGWSKEYSVTYQGSEGTAYEEGLGATTTADGTAAYAYTDRVVTAQGENDYDITLKVACDVEDEGLYVLEWGGNFTYLLFAGFPVEGTIDADLISHRRYLPPSYAVGFKGSWSYDYYLNMNVVSDGSPTPLNSQSTGTYSEVGFDTMTLFDGTEVEAYHLTNTYSITGDVAFSGYIDQWWVKGLGLIKETNTADDGSVLLNRELAAYSGLTIEK